MDAVALRIPSAFSEGVAWLDQSLVVAVFAPTVLVDVVAHLSI